MNDFYIQQQSEPDVKTKRYKSFEGVNLTSDYWSVSDLNSPYMVNMIKDYERGGTLTVSYTHLTLPTKRIV